ncbi:NAD(P)H-dependent glycerol-3-phosphate dehydrogenase [Roseomonas sp. CCTCC AB2023176]|uniref:NAD(P)H-dependent glycerol-3-phosphate dehydrogenase n=1 Tax=Roseomonas sp. CCTCC AB2023176 TaxID=3342640 RepID=UPI0035DF55BC
MRIAVIGAGAWGTALAIQAARVVPDVVLWARDPMRAALMRGVGKNARHLPGVTFPQGMRVTSEAEEALDGAAIAVLAVPTQFLAAVLEGLPPLPPVILAAKGVETATLRLPHEIVAAARPGLSVALLSGPNFAEEIAAGLPAAAVLATTDGDLAEAGVARLSSAAFRVYAGSDPVGVAVGGAAKNVAAIAAGATIGAGYGENARAALVTRALAEIGRLSAALGGRAETVAGLSGLGDLMLTCASPKSRNFSLGVAIGQGEDARAILATRSSVTEGVATAPAILARARSVGVAMPVAEAIAAVLEGKLTVRDAMRSLMTRPLREE